MNKTNKTVTGKSNTTIGQMIKDKMDKDVEKAILRFLDELFGCTVTLGQVSVSNNYLTPEGRAFLRGLTSDENIVFLKKDEYETNSELKKKLYDANSDNRSLRDHVEKLKEELKKSEKKKGWFR